MTKVRLFAHIASRALGDFIVECSVAATIKENFDDASLILYYRNDRWYKQQIAEMFPQFDFLFHPQEKIFEHFPIDCFDTRAYPAVQFRHPEWQKFGGRHTDIVLTSQTLNDFSMPSFERKARLVIPEEKAPHLKETLKTMGLDENRWFACLYWREPGYPDRPPHPFRDIHDPRPYLELAEHIVTKQGGQVVRLGHPGTTSMPEIDGIVDLSVVENNVMLHAYAVSRARYFVSSNSGPVSFGSGFGTPTLITENTDPNGVWNEHDRSLGPDITINKKNYRQRTAYDAGLMSGSTLKRLVASEKTEISISKCTAADLQFGADDLFERTKDVVEWRAAGMPDNGVSTRLNRLQLPLRPSITENFFLNLDHLNTDD